jgi:hypothetical protein
MSILLLAWVVVDIVVVVGCVVVGCVVPCKHCEYQGLPTWHVVGAQQSVEPVYSRPPHWPHSATHGATQSMNIQRTWAIFA